MKLWTDFFFFWIHNFIQLLVLLIMFINITWLRMQCCRWKSCVRVCRSDRFKERKKRKLFDLDEWSQTNEETAQSGIFSLFSFSFGQKKWPIFFIWSWWWRRKKKNQHGPHQSIKQTNEKKDLLKYRNICCMVFDKNQQPIRIMLKLWTFDLQSTNLINDKRFSFFVH